MFKSGEFEEAEIYIRKAIKAGHKRALLDESKKYKEAEKNYHLAIEYGNTAVALWNNEVDIAQENIERILLMDNWQEDINNEKDFIDVLIC